jgi:hypothetical protein
MKEQVSFPVLIGCAVVWGIFQLIVSNAHAFASPPSHSEEIVKSEIATTNTVFSSERIITTDAFGANAVGASDLDNDGDLDVFASCNKNDQVTGHEKIEWYENTSGDGSTWTVHTLMSFWDAPADIAGADLDADGDVDLVVPAQDHTRKVSWFENNGASPPGLTERYVVAGLGDGYRDVQAIDMNQDGSLDVLVAAGYHTHAILWFESDGGTAPSFTMNIIDDTRVEPRRAFGVDLDKDGDIDALATDTDENKVIWYESTGGTSPTFTSHVITNTAGVVASVFSTDMDKDHDNDFIAAVPTENKVYLFENDGSLPPTFHAHSIEENAPGVRAVYAIDLDLDTDVDVVYASAGDDSIAWLENLSTVPPSFQKHVLGATKDNASNVYAADIDNDGDPDVLSASSQYDTIAWYENLGADPGADPDFELAERFAPFMYFQLDDIYRPISVTVPVELNILRNPDEDRKEPSPSLIDLTTPLWNKQSTYIDLYGDGSREIREDYRNRIMPRESPLVFAHVKRDGPDGTIAIQYWFYYYDNSWINHHEGDWEMIQVVLDSNEDPLHAAYAQHDHGSRRRWNDIDTIEIEDEEHPVVYVARGSHASYFRPYDYWQLGPVDETRPPVAERMAPIQILPESSAEDTWLYFKGHWGDKGKGVLAGGAIIDQDGPTGPPQKDEKWNDPFGWSASLPWDEDAIHTLNKFRASVPVPLDIHVYELPSLRHVGWKDGQLEVEIWDAEYFDNPGSGFRTILLHKVAADDSRYQALIDYREGTFSDLAEAAAKPMTMTLGFPDLQASTVITALYSLSNTWQVSATASISVHHGSNFHMIVDSDGNGTPDQEVVPKALVETPIDFTAPESIIDLAVLTSTFDSVVLTWTASGDDGDTGTATAYDIRYHPSIITSSNWMSATMVISPPLPSSAGVTEVFTATGIPGGMQYFAIRVLDEVFHHSELSNVAHDWGGYSVCLPLVRYDRRCIAAGELMWWYQGDHCCAGLSGIPLTVPCDPPGVGGCKVDGCTYIPPCACDRCAPCGDGVCQPEYGENRCSCPADCG